MVGSIPPAAIPTVSAPRIPKGTSQSFESRTLQRKETRASKYLTEVERGELTYLWQEYDSELGVRSVQGAIESRLLLAPLKERAGKNILEELARNGGRVPEGSLIQILVFEGVASRHEIRSWIQRLVNYGKVTRQPSENVPKHPPDGWIGTDILLVGAEERGTISMRLALSSVHSSLRSDGHAKRTRWQSQDEDIERMWRQMSCHPNAHRHGAVNWAEGENRNRSVRAERILSTLECMPRSSVSVLHRVYGRRALSPWHAEFGELAPLVEFTRRVAEDREALIAKLAEERMRVSLDISVPMRIDSANIRRQCARAISPEMVVRTALGTSGREEFVSEVREQADAMLVAASLEYRKARRVR